MKNALGMMLTGRHVSAEEGMRLGFVNEVVEPDNLLSAAKIRLNKLKNVLQCPSELQTSRL